MATSSFSGEGFFHDQSTNQRGVARSTSVWRRPASLQRPSQRGSSLSP